jgi:glycerol-3-phosphate O-acyltransferase/dihydroxyacetone phosphate acyltransferase
MVKLTNTVPVARAADYAKAGSGRITLSATDPLLVTGQGTKFTSEIKPRSQIMLPKGVAYASASIEEVISDTELRLKSDFTIPSKDGNSNVKATQRVRTDKGAESGWEYKILPYVDQDETYGAVFKRLNEGGCIGIFPEGAYLCFGVARKGMLL